MVKPWVPHPVTGDSSPNLFRNGRRGGLFQTFKNVIILALACLSGGFGTLVFLCGQVQLPVAPTTAECLVGDPPQPTGAKAPATIVPPPATPPPPPHEETTAAAKPTAPAPAAPPLGSPAPAAEPAVTATPGVAVAPPGMAVDFTPPQEAEEEGSPAPAPPVTATAPAVVTELPAYAPLPVANPEASDDQAVGATLPMAAMPQGEELVVVEGKGEGPANFPKVRPGSHLVLLGTFSDPVNATKLSDKLVNAGVPVRLKRKMKDDTLLTHVQVGPFSSADEAKQAATALETLTGLKVYRIHTDEIVPR